MNRWTASGLWQKLNEHKSVFFEEKSSANFQTTIIRFREANGTLKIVKPLSAAAKRVNALFKRRNKSEEILTTNSPYFTGKGGLLLAVCRGRASEGIDFSDNNARCVIILGIPYPNVRDEEVIFKRNYNNEQNKNMPQVMNGSDWYDSQAYHALNQALGRCIRHKNDWAALLIVDERIVQNMNDKQFNNKISLWIKQRLFISRQYNDTMNALEKFVNDMKKSDEISILENEQQEQGQLSEKKLMDDDEQQEQIQQSEKKLTDDQQRRFSLLLPPLTEVSKKEEETKSVHRQWKVDDLTDDHDEKGKENHPKQIKSKAFEKFIAQRPISMLPPLRSSRMQEIVDQTDDNNEKINKKHSKQIKSQTCKKCSTQLPIPILSTKMNSSQTQTIIDLTDDDDDDFDQSASSFSYRPTKTFKPT